MKKRIQEAVNKAKGIVDDKYVALVERGVKVAVVALEAASFGARQSPLLAFSALAASSLPTYWVRRGDDLAAALGLQALGRSLAGQLARGR